MFERAAIFSALLILIVFYSVSLKYYKTLDVKPLSVTTKEGIDLK